MSHDRKRPAWGQPLLWTLLFVLLAIAAVVFNTRQTRVVVIRAAAEAEPAARAFDNGLRAGFGPRTRVDLRSLRIARSATDPARYCGSVLYAIEDMTPTLLVAVGEKAAICLLRSDQARHTPSLLVGTGMPAAAGRFAAVMPALPRQTWAEALQSQAQPGSIYRVLYLAADNAAGRAEQAQFAALALPGVSVSTRLAANFTQWQGAAQAAAAQADLLVIGAGRSLLALPAGWSDAELVAHTRAAFGAPIAATDVEAVGQGAAWGIAPDPHELGDQAAAAALALLQRASVPSARPPAILIAIDAAMHPTRRPLPPLFDAVARYQGRYLGKR